VLKIRWKGAYEAAARATEDGAFIPISHTDEDEEGAGDIPLATNPDIEKTVIFREGLRNLSSEARQVVKLILNTPSDIADLIVTPVKKELSSKTVAVFLTEYYGWSQQKIQKVFKEIRMMLKEE